MSGDTTAFDQQCPLGCSGPEQGGTGCVAVTGECALDSQLTARALHLIDVLIPFRLRLIDKGECVDASVQTIRDALPEVRAALSKVHEQQIQQPSCALASSGETQPAITQTQDAERETFETWIAGEMPDLLPLARNFDDYQRVGTQMAWRSWQARAAQNQPLKGVDADVIRNALARLERAVDLHLGRSVWTQTRDLKGMAYSEAVRKELYAAHDAARAALSSGGMRDAHVKGAEANSQSGVSPVALTQPAITQAEKK